LSTPVTPDVDASTFAPDASTPAVDSSMPAADLAGVDCAAACAAAGANCGTIAGGCDCGQCQGTQVCGGGGPNVCGDQPCIPTTCAAQGYTCGPLSDGCNLTPLDCGQCTAPATCGGGGVPHQCGTLWSVESPGTVRTYDQIVSRLLMDSAGHFHFVLLDTNSNDIRLATFDAGGALSDETIAAGAHNGNYGPSGWEGLAIDLWDQIHVTYQADWDLHHAQKYGPGNWGDDKVETSTGIFGSGFGGSSAVVTDGAGGAHIVYTDGDAPAVRYAWRPSGGSWQAQLLDGNAKGPGTCALVIDAGGVLHALYESTSPAVSYAEMPAGGAWSVSPVPAPGDAQFWGGFVLGSNGSAHYLGFHLSGVIGADEPIVYGYRPAGGAWTFDEVAVPDTAGRDTDNVLIGPDGKVHHVEGRQDGIVYAKRDPQGAWTSELVGFNHRSDGLNVSMVFDTAGVLHVVYIDQNHALMHAWRKP
jgi:hypothetical protein